MNTEDLTQGSEEWHEARLGMVTASRFGDILTLPRSKKDQEAGKLSTTAQSYMIEKLTEIMTGEARQLVGVALEWGTVNEPLARERYELDTLQLVTEVGLVEKEIGKYTIGGSPDGLVGEDGIIEIKCPYNTSNHVETLLGKPISKGYFAQIQGNLYVTGRQWCDYISYDPRILKEQSQIVITRVQRDEDYIQNLEHRLLQFLEHLYFLLKENDI